MTKNIALVYGTFHQEAAATMLSAARDAAKEADLKIIKEVAVPGSFEAPLATKRLLQDKDIHGVACLGVLERGETSHGAVIAQAVFKSLLDLQLEFMKPVGLGIIGPDIHPSQIESRLRPAGRAAVMAIAHMQKDT